MSKPKVITLCGSTKFKKEYEYWYRRLSQEGYIVLTVVLFGHHEGLDMEGLDKKRFDELHLRKIDISDEIFVINVGGYIGESTKREIEYAKKHNLSIIYLEIPFNWEI